MQSENRKLVNKKFKFKLVVAASVIMILILMNSISHFSDKTILGLGAFISLGSGLLWLYAAKNFRIPENEDIYGLNSRQYTYAVFGFVCFLIFLYALLFH